MFTDELLTYLFDGGPHTLTEPMGAWLGSSRRFTAFVDTCRDKIRKKIRVTQEEETLLDLRLELETAYLLLREKSLSLAYEPQLAERVRSPDFAVTYTTSLTFSLEVTRLRSNPRSAEEQASGTNIIGERLADAVCSKLGQLIHQQSNVLLAGVETLTLTQEEVRAAMLRVQQRVERSDPAFFQRYRFRDRADFFRCYQRLSEILVRETDSQNGGSFIAWVNPQGKIPLPSKVRTVLYRSQAG
jgi:hypothetical protein